MNVVRWFAPMLLLLSLGVVVTDARGGTVQDAVQVSVNVVATCVATTTPVSFGDVQLEQKEVATGQIIVKCNGLVPFEIALDAGQSYDGTWRGISNGSRRIDYGLYSVLKKEWGDSGYDDTYPWGFPVPGVGTGNAETYTVIGVLFPGTLKVPPGIYFDTVVVTLHF